MGEVVELFQKLSTLDAKNKILDNLKEMHHGKLVNYPCAVHGVDDPKTASAALNELISESQIATQKYRMNDQDEVPAYVTMYRYNFFLG